MTTAQRLIDYFVISGLDTVSGLEPDLLAGDNLHCPPLERPYKAHVLAHYPENVAWNPFDGAAVSILCHPKGVHFKTQRDRHETAFHPYLITREDGSRTYGAALTYYEAMDNRQICTAMQTLQSMHMAELSNAQSRTLYSHLGHVHRRSPRIHKKPDAQTVGKVFDSSRDTLYVTKCISILSPLPLTHSFEKILRAVYDSVISTEATELSLESHIYNLIYEIPLPPAGRSLKFTCVGQPVICQRPSDTELPLLDLPLREMFQLLGVDNVLSIFSSVLLEHQVLLYSNDYKRLMLVAEGVTCVLFPFQWQHVYVPILPASLTHFLDAPVPYIMGLHHCNESNQLMDLCSQAHVCFVDIDNGTVDLPEDLPVLPHSSAMKDDLVHLLRQRTKDSSDTQNGNMRDSGFRDSFSGGLHDSGMSSTDGSQSSSMWSIPNKMEILQQSEALAKITALAKKTGVISSLEDISDSLNESLCDLSFKSRKKKSQVDDYVRDLMLNSSLREIFLYYFLQIFNSYEAFVIQPNQDMDAWLNNREIMQNFDKAAFLSDQPEAHLPFLSAFIESQMFTSFIDNKIIAQWEDPDPQLRVFEDRLQRYREDNGDPQLRRFHRSTWAKEAEGVIEKRATMVDVIARPAKQTEGVHRHHRPGVFPQLNADILNTEPTGNKTKRDGARWRKKERLHHHADHLQLSMDQREKYIQEARSKGVRQPKLTDMNPAAMVQTNWKFVETLLKECRAKTKRMLVEKMGQEAVELGHGDAILTGVEENTLIANLCDLLERIWSHGLQQKQGKSALWSHLLSYQEVERQQDSEKSGDSNLLTPDLSGVALDGDMQCPSGTQTWPIRRHRRKPSRGPELPTLGPQPVSVTFDMRCVQQMADIKTAVGQARAWVRLSLEKKLLATHLKEFLANTNLSKSLYKRYAFLRCEDEREQFLFHLLSLNAVDYYCFTNTFTSTVIPYRVLIFPRQKISGGTTTANCWLCLAGRLGETEKVAIAKHNLDISFRNKNMGILTTMRLGHDNAGMSPKWMVEHVLVRNEITGHTYRFPCGRWLGKGVDDGSLERLLVAEPVPASTTHADLMEKCRTPPRCRSPSMPRRSSESKLHISEIQEMLGDAVNNLVKHFYKPEKERGSVTGLLCGENGLVYCMEHVFQCGFRSSRLFRNRFFIWDFLEKVRDNFEGLISDSEQYVVAEDIKRTMFTFCHVINRISEASEAMGKDGKFQLFICIGVRDFWLQRWLKTMSKTPVTTSMYEERSFLRDPSLLQFLIQILDSLKDFEVTLEVSLIKGVKL